MNIKMLAEIAAISAMSLIAAVPWDGTPMFPLHLVMFALIGSFMAVVMIPVQNRTMGVVVSTGVVGVGLALLATEAVVQWLNIEKVAYARALAGALAFAAMPICGLFLKLVDRVTNSEHFIGGILEFIYSRGKPPNDSQPSSGRALPPQ